MIKLCKKRSGRAWTRGIEFYGFEYDELLDDIDFLGGIFEGAFEVKTPPG